MEKGPRPEGSKPNRRKFLGGLLAAGAAAGTASYFLQNNQEQPSEESPNQTPDSIETIPSYGPFGMRSVLEHQLQRGDTLTYGAKEELHVNMTWGKRMQTTAFMESLTAANQRIKTAHEEFAPAIHVDLITKVFEQEKVPAKLLYISFAETWFNKAIISRTGAKGPYQFQEATAIEYGLIEKDKKGKTIRDDREDPLKSARAAARYLRHFADAFKRKGTPENEAWDLAVLAYNGGYAQTYLAREKNPTMAGFREFVTKEMQKTLEFAKADRSRPVRPGETLKSLSQKCGLSERALKETNPTVDWQKLVAFKTNITFPGVEKAPLFEKITDNETLASAAHRLGASEKNLKDKNPGIVWNATHPALEIAVPEHSKAHADFVRARKLQVLGGFVENVDYLAKTKAIIYAVQNYNLSPRVPLPPRRTNLT